jgi:hypothetical protein
LVEDEGYAADHIFQCLLRSERNGNAADAESSQTTQEASEKRKRFSGPV